jgi:hypothetical protein
MSPREFLRVYNRVTAKFCNGFKVFPRKVSEPALEQCADFMRWCKSESVDPERFIRARHEATGWRFRIPLGRLSGVSPVFVDKFKEWGDGKQTETQIDEKLAAIVVDDTDRSAHTTALSERVKLEFAESPETCLLSIDLSLGWHPESVWCSKCRLAEACKSRLPAGVVVARGAR